MEADGTPPVGPRRLLIVNADDFGASRGVNEGIRRAHDLGVVTSASLMVRMPATDDAVSLARARPGLSVGLHADLTGEGTPPPIQDLTDVAACRRELTAQLELLTALVGRPPTHLDAHHNIYRLPQLEPLFVELAGEWGLPLREHSRVRYFPDFYGQWDDGDTHPEWIGAENLIRMLDQDVGPGVTELSCHPGLVDPSFDSPYHRERELELSALCDPRVHSHLAQSDILLISYHDVDQGAGAR
jgi:predicted glycoside hydrolase/deacetylase ChbG (UPF0249 family)